MIMQPSILGNDLYRPPHLGDCGVQVSPRLEGLSKMDACLRRRCGATRTAGLVMLERLGI